MIPTESDHSPMFASWAPPPPPPPPPPGGGGAPGAGWGQRPPVGDPGRGHPLPGWGPPSGATPPPQPPRPPQPPWEAPRPSRGPLFGDVSVQNLLLGLGTALIAVAAVVFTAVNWDRMGATAQGALLVVLAAVAAVATLTAARKRMPATAEALGLVTVLLSLVDAHALRVGLVPDGDPASYWAGALVLVAAGAWVLGRAADIRSTRLAAVVLGQLPLPVGLLAIEPGPTAAGLALVAQVAVVIGASAWFNSAPKANRILAASLAVATWLGVLADASGRAILQDGTDRLGPASVLAAVAAVAALVAWLSAAYDDGRHGALAVATSLGFGAGLAATTALAEGHVVWPVMALAAVVVLAVAARVDGRWGRVPAGVAASVGVAASLPLLGALGIVLEGLGRVTDRAWDLEPGAVAVTARHLVGAPSPGVLGLHLLAAAGLLAAVLPLVPRRWLVASGAVLAATAVALVPVLGPVSVATAAGACALAVLVATALAVVAGDRRSVLAGAATAVALLSVLGLGWAAATPALTLTGLGLVLAVALVFFGLGRAAGSLELAGTTSVLLVAGTGAFAGLAFLADGRSAGMAVVAAGAAALAAALVGTQLLDPAGRGDDLDGQLARAMEATSAVAHGIALLAVLGLADVDAISGVLAAGALAAGLHAARPGRRMLVLPAVAQGLALTWLQLGTHHVDLVEAYTLPLAGVLLLAGLLGEHRARTTGETVASWASLGPALVVGLAPTTWLALLDGGDVRPLAGLAAGTLVLVLGAVLRRRAAVDVGVAVVAILGFRQLAPVVAELPNWATVGAAGVVLLAVGATFEQRRRDVRDVRDRYATLR
jgi:hypothetical protein